MTNTSFAKIALALAIAVPGVASAQTLTVDNLEAAWSNPVGGANVSINNANATKTARWGSTTDSRSGYDFTGRTTNFDVTLGGGFALFKLGDFTHQNFPIGSGTGITGIQLDIDLGFTDSPSTFSQFFQINHFETPNSANPCADDGAPGVPPNQNGCADQVTFANSGSSEVVVVDGIQYTLELEGFTTNNGLTFTDEFWTVENSTNSAELYARITAGGPVIVPEPASFALAAFGLAGLGVVARRRRNA